MTSTTSDVEFTAPDWINADLIEKSLHNSREKNLQVKDLSVSIATAAGDNYASTIYRVKAALSDGSESSFVVKGPAPGETLAVISLEIGAFRREAFVLGEVIPQMQVILEEAEPVKSQPFAARYFLYDSQPVDFLMLEDLAPGGFKMADSKRGLDFDHCLLALRDLARFHAASHALLRKQPELAEKLPNPWAVRSPGAEMFVGLLVQAAADACRLWPGFEEYATLLEKFKIVAADVVAELNDLRPGALDVITHGDFWVNNLMFRYEDGDSKPQGLRMLDFQFSAAAASPALDLLFFFASSVDEDVSTHHEDTLVKEYHSALKETLALLGLQAPSLEGLLADMKIRGAFALISTLKLIPVLRSLRPFVLEPVFTGDTSSFTSLYEDPGVKKWMQRVLPEYKRKGWLSS